MKPHFSARSLLSALVVAAALGAPAAPAGAATTDISQVPLGTASTTAVLPNLMFILDDSGSMGRAWMPDNVDANSNCKRYRASGGGSGGSDRTNCVLDQNSLATVSPATDGVRHVPALEWPAGPPYFAAQFNTMYYNPQITYNPGKDGAGADMPSFDNTAAGRMWNAVKVNPYVSTNTVDVTTLWPEPVFCSNSGSTPTNSTECRRNGFDTAGTTLLASFRYSSANADATGGYGWPIATGGGSDFRFLRMRFGAPHYFTILPREHCADINLTDCVLSSTPAGTYTIPAPVRYCTTELLANQDAAVTLGTPTSCQSKIDGAHQFVRYGTFVRTDIVSTGTFTGRPNRTDCAANPVCSFNEEMTNFANWFAYYHTRMQTMKSSAGRVFATMDDRYRIGFVTINAADATRYLKIDKFDVTHKADWYTKFYAQVPGPTTPLRRALSRVGRHYAGMTDGINSFMPDDPLQYSCQQNFALLTTDGYWNSSGGLKLNGTTVMDNQDGLVETFVNRPTGTLDGAGMTVTDTFSSRTLEQVVCQANAAGSANFSGTPDTNCGCAVNLKRVKQRTLDDITTTTTVDGVAGPPTTNTVPTFQDITVCNALQQTTVTRVTIAEQVVCTRNNTANFPGTPDTNCGCPTGNPMQSRVKQRSRDWDQAAVSYDGVPSAPTFTNPGAASFQDITACTTGSVTAGAQTITPVGAPVTTSSGATITTADFTISPNPTVLPGTSTSSTTPGGFGDTLADVAMYYYKTDLRSTGAIGITKNNVPTSPKDQASHQHMVTFTLGLGLDGLMNYRPDYETATTGDFHQIKTGATGCSFSPGGTGSICNWPQPIADAPSALDDLWHAAVNGRGQYFSAKDPNTLQSGLTSALSQIKTTLGAAAAAATSNANLTPTDSFEYASTYQTVKWDGEVVAKKIDVVTGEPSATISWAIGPKLDARSLPASDDRTIWTFAPSEPTKLNPFKYANLSGTEQAFFDNHCTLNPTIWPQCGAMSPADLAIANSGTNLVNYLRGQKQHETNYYRFREHTLGDTVNAKPVFVGKPDLLYGDAVVPDYNSFKSGPAASRTPTVFIGANDGMLHAFHAGEEVDGGGTELWTFVPRMLQSELFKLAATNYDVNHRYYVDGTPVTMDVFIGGAWKTILVGGLNAGGRGYYALDVTNTSSPKGMWEVCADPTGTLACTDKDDNIGYTFGQPIITKDPKDGKWVVIVTSGYNNVLPGDGKGYIYIIDAETGLIKDKKDTGIGDTVTPSGFAKISGFALDFAVNNTTTIVYGGDLLGNVFSFDMANRVFQIIGQTKDASGKPQSITTRPEITRFNAGFNVIYVATGRFLGASDLPDPATLIPPLNLAYQQTIYGFKDTGTDLGSLREPAAKLVQQVMSLIDATNRTISNNAVDWSTQNGWWVDLNPASDSPGERVYEDMQLVRGVLLVSANEPNNEACSTGGNRFFYQFDYRSGSYVASSPGQVVGKKAGAALSAGFVVYRLPSGQLKILGRDIKGNELPDSVLPGSSGALGRRATWRELYQ